MHRRCCLRRRSASQTRERSQALLRLEHERNRVCLGDLGSGSKCRIPTARCGQEITAWVSWHLTPARDLFNTCLESALIQPLQLIRQNFERTDLSSIAIWTRCPDRNGELPRQPHLTREQLAVERLGKLLLRRCPPHGIELWQRRHSIGPVEVRSFGIESEQPQRNPARLT